MDDHGIFTAGYSSAGNRAHPAEYFSSYDDYYRVTPKKIATRAEAPIIEATLHHHEYEYVADGAVINAICLCYELRGDCGLTDGKIILTVAAENAE
ncbi:MAG: hypothetical protein J5822_09235 [Eubacteriaceae bacterium]|nr:hypothetical protein [Eubacteriaceae bacterium]